MVVVVVGATVVVVVVGATVVVVVVVVGATVVTTLVGAAVVADSVTAGAAAETVEVGTTRSPPRSSLQETSDATVRRTSTAPMVRPPAGIRTVAPLRRSRPVVSCPSQAWSGIQLPWAP